MSQVQDNLKDAWLAFINGHEFGHGSIRPMIRRSWERCKASGISPFQKVVPKVLNAQKVYELREINKKILEPSRPVMRTLYDFVSGSGFVVAISDSQGVILEIFGDTDVITSFEKGNFVVGADWSELTAGTNGIGTCLIEKHPLQIISYEHYCICAQGTTCSSAPIHDHNGVLVGAIDMSGSFEKVHPHTLGMVVAGAKAIERQMVMEKAREERDRSNEVREAVMESISEGLLATDREGIVININKAAAGILRIQPNAALGKPIRKILQSKERDWDDVLSGNKFITDQERDVETSCGNLKLIISSRPVRRKTKQYEGVVLVVNEISRARKIAQRISGAVARLTFDDLVGSVPLFRESISLAKMASGTDSTVLLLGESGTGKDILAQAIHNASSRAAGPFVAINCGAIPRELIASELFGYMEGAFTGAKRGGSPGKFELADGGTIFLDEIGDMSTELQTTLLRVLEQKTITRIGGSTVIPVNVRVISATNRELLREIELGNFRRDLYYRLNIVNIRLVPLREREPDIRNLFEYFLNSLGRQMGKPIYSVSDQIWPYLEAYNWPGNVRELQNTVERALHLVKDGSVELEHLPKEIRTTKITSYNLDNFVPVANYEKEIITELMEKTQGNISQVASQLGMARTTLYRKINKYGLPKFR